MNSKRESSFKLSEAENLSYKRNSDQNFNNSFLQFERNSNDFRFMNMKERISKKFKREGIPKFSLIRSSKDINGQLPKRFSDNIARPPLKKNEYEVKFKTTNIKKIKNGLNPSIERFKTNVKEVCSGINLFY